MAPPIKSTKQGGGAVNNLTGKSNTTESSDMISNNLWVGNLAADVTDAELRNLFEKHGAVDSITCYPSRSYAFIYLKRAEDAKAAKDALQGVLLRGNPLKIEFAKPAKPCKSLWVSGISSSVSKEDLEKEFSKFGKIEDFKFLRDKNTAYVDYFRLDDASKALKVMNGKKKGGNQIRVDYLRSHSRRPILPSEGRKGEGEQPSNILFISYPPAVHIDEQMLHNAMILFGEIEKIRNFPSRHYSFVEFRSIEEAQRAKEGLQGHLFNDPRISIMFSTSELAPTSEISGFYPAKGPTADALFNELAFQPGQLDVYGQPVVPNSFHGRVTPRGVGGPDISVRPFASPGGFESIVRPEFSTSDPNPINPLVVPNWRRSSPTPGMLSSPSGVITPSTRPASGTWDVFDASQIQREAKRLRTENAMPLKEMKDPVLGPDHVYRGIPKVRGVSPVTTRFTTGGADMGLPDLDYVWRGIIAKGGSPVCRARCVPVGDWIGYEIPEVVNCSARTGLDMLAKHYADAVGFDIIFFLPDSEEDFASYTEFLRYLGDRNRAGVAKFEDGTTLFLVPPSEFLTKVLNVSGPERLYGVVLKFRQHASSSTAVGPLSSHPQYIDKPQVPSRNDYNVMPQEERVLQIDYSGLPHEDPKSSQKLLGPPTSHPPPVHLVPPVTSASATLPGLSLTPELIATLASLAKGNSIGQQPSGSTVGGPVLTSAVPDGRPIQGWEYEHRAPDLMHQVGGSFHSQAQILPQHQAYPSNMINDSQKAVISNSHIQDLAFSLPHQEAVPSIPSSSLQTPPLSGPFAVHSQASLQYQPDFPQDTHTGYGLDQKADAPFFQPGTNPVTTSSQVYGANVYQSQSTMPAGAETSSLQLPEQIQQLQSALCGANQQMSEFDADKNQRYQSTLQFAANLLLQIHSKQPGTDAGQGGGNH